MTAVLLDHENYQRYLEIMYDHNCGDVALSYADWCTACREES